jgi:hypothetical protein
MAKTDTDASTGPRLPGGAKLYALALATGFLAAPPLIWLTGRSLFGPYANGGVFTLWGDFFGLLARGSFAAWVVALAPLALLLLVRAAVALSRRVG